jgi:hypothetical protein
MKFRCFPKDATAEDMKKVSRPAAVAGGPRMSADGSYMERGAKAKTTPLSDVEGDGEIDEEIARAFANGVMVDTPSAGGSPPSSPVSDPAAASSADELAKRTVIILDWDDTLLTTTRLTSRYSVYGVGASKPLPASLTRELHALEKDVIQLLESCIGRGRTVIVTNAAKGWVQQSGRRFVPRVVEVIAKHNISVVSAQAAYAHTCPSGNPADWKKKAFMRELKGERINLVSIGDSIFEREAAHFVSSKHKNVEATKTVKFIDSPTIAQLRRQLVTATEKLPMVCDAEKSFDVDMEV